MTGQGFTFDPDSSDPCPNCGEPYKEHPILNVSKVNMLALCGHRHPKWQRAEPGTVIPAGQPYRLEFPSLSDKQVLASERVTIDDVVVPNEMTTDVDWFVDSSWEPPLVLPTEPTWGIAIHRKYGRLLSEWWMDAGEDFNHLGGSFRAHNVLDFIPLTDEQVARIKAAR